MERVPPLPDDVLDLGRSLIPRPVFLVGCPRSGTSILGETLAAHPAVTYLYEPDWVWRSAVAERDDHRLEPVDATAETARKVYEGLARAAAEAEGGGPVLLEKNPKHVVRLGFLARLFPWGKFLHILRDGRDVVASLMFRNRGREWGHVKIPGWRELLEKYPEANHIRCAYQWREAVRLAREDARVLEPERYLEVRYEDFVREPRAVARRCLEFMGLGPSVEVDEAAARVQDETAGSYHARKQVRHYVENHSRRIGRHRENLTPRQIEEVTEITRDLLRTLGYLDIPGSTLG